MCAKKYLFLLGVDNIQGYIFSTNKLKPIIGASWIVDHINYTQTRVFLDKLNNSSYELVYSSGGNTCVKFDSKDTAKKFERKLNSEYSKFGISVTTHIEPLNDGEREFDAFSRARKKLAQKKYNKLSATNLPSSPYFKICELCGKDYAQEWIQTPDKELVFVCPACKQRDELAKSEFRPLKGLKFITQIDRMDTTRGLVALVVMDGNNMGQKINKLSNLQGSFFENLREFAEQTKNILETSFKDLIKNANNSKEIKWLRPLILGGDDICFLIDAGRALRFVLNFICNVEKASEKKDKQGLFDGSITFSAGILFMKINYPFNFARAIAESLLHSAKRESRENNHCSMVDFHILLSSGADRIESIRTREYTLPNFHMLTAKPYKPDELKELIDDAMKLKEILAGRKLKIPRKVLRLGRYQSTTRILGLLKNLGSQQIKDVRDLLNKNLWFKAKGEIFWKTKVLDLTELVDLLEGT